MQKSKYFGDRGFYKYVLGLAIPIIIQNFITNFLSMLDNLMVGTLGTASMSGVSVANQFLFVYMLAIFGLVSGAGIFGAQYAGNNDPDGLRNAFRFKVAAGLLLTFLFCWLYAVQNEFLIGLYLKGDGDPALRAETLAVAKKYMLIMLVGLYPAAMTQAYASTLRETGQTKVPMAASMTGVLVNLIGDYVLIFGKFGAPRLEVAGAAIATVFARFVELAFLIIWTHTHTSSGLISFASKAYRSFKIPGTLIRGIIVKGTPLMLNEVIWAAGMTRLTQCYSHRGIDVVAAFSISQTFWGLFGTIFLSMGATVGIVVGQKLGAGDMKEVKYTAYKLVVLSLGMSIVTAVLYVIASLFVPELYSTTAEVKHIATRLMMIASIAMPADSICNSTYFTVRSGGKTIITFIMDAGFVWVFLVTTATLLVNFTALSVFWIYFVIQLLNYVKAAIGIYLTMEGKWINNLINENAQA
ncbi:MAG: MATE family efflux transporter [Clostridia bacterium]|nr:MATE family efflux transporter [Clostridia bacterium]MBR5991496.1 MATE family efflux transporter [Clostridia bacterium]MBR6478980.1 MATE family efflux transporter [Clostridia bacterium]MBR6513009.1 MATE family efflux transporter [Clostridia bacterium]